MSTPRLTVFAFSTAPGWGLPSREPFAFERARPDAATPPDELPAQ